ncbi:MAG: XRE family transcriptional regulator, partial [Actinophytocola sp.]|nr:XRE family transcriptional regulator [Actinophytocola sp.]
WAAVADAISERLTELKMKQRELADRSRVSPATVREIQHNSAQRHRSDRTLEALSEALDWHPQHLSAVLHDRKPPAVGEPHEDMTDPVTARLDRIEGRLAAIIEQLNALRAAMDEWQRR